ncbi:heat-shock protein Hsp20 [Mycolicibacterium duvalii]|uniref:Heat-shock protein Hsp20 n=1 Tax=Mycolicibacterium duvalii TaxID=39688 RepID=A0A7I7K4V8_9MYCO|nr:Hsp20/alpha crystallin family protein [Mycolicibacterium duvalii]MCV7368922.1 Hsp20/alpha crystallin family protein [Mycolicibacterium duvalii]PEG44410.1 heat-shock protein Hsp20 [Mycolicibacterium duvalii]BBX19180.1 heat-shock protein Hsp20 [Mycolicibacterium duvalii]
MNNVALWNRPAWTADRLMRDFFGPSAPAPGAAISPAVEITQDGDDAVVRVDLPGVDVEKDVTVEVENGRLVIHGERRDERSEERAEDGRVRRISEVRYGSFRRSFALPSHVTGDAVSAAYDAGVLTVRVAGAHRNAQAQRIAIEAK